MVRNNFYKFAISLYVFMNLQGGVLYAASGFGCSGVAGSVIFRDAFYGTLTGGLISGMVVLASDDGDKNAKIGGKLATGALVGSVFGVGLGILEVVTRDCGEPSRGSSSLERSFKSRVVMLAPREGDHLGYGISFEKLL